MKLSLTRPPDTAASTSHITVELCKWYAKKPRIRQLWAIREDIPHRAMQQDKVLVVLLLEPSGDGDDAGPTWLAHGRTWHQELRLHLACEVDLRRIDGPLPDEFDIDADGRLIARLCWRDPTSVEA
jgi:hypothetical protein